MALKTTMASQDQEVECVFWYRESSSVVAGLNFVGGFVRGRPGLRPASRDIGLSCALALVASAKIKFVAKEHSLKLRRSS